MTLVALPCAVVSYTTCELVTFVTVTPGGGTVVEGKIAISIIMTSLYCTCTCKSLIQQCLYIMGIIMDNCAFEWTLTNCYVQIGVALFETKSLSVDKRIYCM